ncbi:MAG TPA: hypothetical protein VK157_17340 [Phycisphaerales bacterium]|nr:hypothetical protein [Phycisphaerales bacterium]
MTMKEGQLEPFVREYYNALYKQGGDVMSTVIEPRVGREPGYTLIILGIVGLLVLPVGIAILLAHFVRVSSYRRRRDGVKRAATTGRLRSFEPVLINEEFLEGKADMSAGLFMGVADDGPELEHEQLMDAMTEVQFAEPKSAIDAMMKDDRYGVFRRRTIPLKSGGVRAVTFFDMSLVRARHKMPLTNSAEYFAMVEPGATQNAAFFVPDVVVAYAKARAAGQQVPMPQEPLLAASGQQR